MPRPNRKPNNPDAPRPYAEIGERIKQFRFDNDYNQSIFEGVYGSLPRVSLVETGLRAPSIEMLRRLRELGADLNWIVTGEKP